MKAIAVFGYPSDVSGYVSFSQEKERDPVEVEIHLSGLESNRPYGFHIHTYGDLRNGCESLGPHFNPFSTPHGSYLLHGKNRHVGDMINNIITDKDGNANHFFLDDLLSLHGSRSILGRSVILHSGIDDLGTGGEESLRTGNAGERMACAIIGIFNPDA